MMMMMMPAATQSASDGQPSSSSSSAAAVPTTERLTARRSMAAAQTVNLNTMHLMISSEGNYWNALYWLILQFGSYVDLHMSLQFSLSGRLLMLTLRLEEKIVVPLIGLIVMA